MNKEDQTHHDEETPRQKANRFFGLGSYAMGAVLLGILGIGIYDDPNSLRTDFDVFTMIAAGSLICFAIGYTTGRRK